MNEGIGTNNGLTDPRTPDAENGSVVISGYGVGPRMVLDEPKTPVQGELVKLCSPQSRAGAKMFLDFIQLQTVLKGNESIDQGKNSSIPGEMEPTGGISANRTMIIHRDAYSGQHRVVLLHLTAQ